MATIRVADDLALRLPNQPGAMAALLDAFDRAGVSLHGLCGVAEGALDVDHFLVDDPVAARAAAIRAGASEPRLRQVMVVEGNQAEIDLAAVTDRIASAGVGLDLIYLASNGALVLGVDDLEAARRALDVLARGAPS